jgi:hypothetical protein
MFVESRGVIADRIYDQRIDGDFAALTALDGVCQQIRAVTMTLPAIIDRHTAQQGDGNKGIAREPARLIRAQAREPNAMRSQRIVADDVTRVAVVVTKDVANRYMSSSVLQGDRADVRCERLLTT